MSKRPAFTLLETMIALAVVAMGVVAGAQINRALFITNQVSEDSIQATNLADEGISMIELTQSYVQHTTSGSKNLSSYFRLPGANQTIKILPYSNAGAVANQLTIKWCIDGVGDAGISVTTSTCFSQYSKVLNNSGAQQTLQTLASGGDSIAVNRSATTDGRSIVDATTATGTNVSYGSTAWDYYTRVMTIDEVTLDNSVQGYQVTATVTNNFTHLSVKRTVFLTDNAT